MSQSFEGIVKSIENENENENENEKATQGSPPPSMFGLPQILVDDDFSPLTGKPYYHCIVTNSHLNKQSYMAFPAKLHPNLPTKSVPALVTCRGKTWEMMFLGAGQKKRFDIQSWKKFAAENNLKYGDALFWEVMESSDDKVEFKVQIIRGDFPSELEAQVNGETEATPIVID